MYLSATGAALPNCDFTFSLVKHVYSLSYLRVKTGERSENIHILYDVLLCSY